MCQLDHKQKRIEELVTSRGQVVAEAGDARTQRLLQEADQVRVTTDAVDDDPGSGKRDARPS